MGHKTYFAYKGYNVWSMIKWPVIYRFEQAFGPEDF